MGVGGGGVEVTWVAVEKRGAGGIIVACVVKGQGLEGRKEGREGGREARKCTCVRLSVVERVYY